MPETAAQELAEAQRRLLDPELPREAHEQAAADFVRSFTHFLDKLGVERRPEVRIGNLIGVVLVIAIAVSMVFNIRYSTTASSTAGTARAAATEVAQLQGFLTAAVRAACERGNERSVSDLRNLRADRAKLRREVAFLASVLPAHSPPLDRYLAAVRHDIAVKTRTIHEHLASVADVAKRQGSAEANCKAAFPLTRAAVERLR